MKKKVLFILLNLCFVFYGFSKTYGNQELIQAGHWVYDALQVLNSEQKKASFAVNAPLSVGELKLYFSDVDYDKLSDGSKKLYDKIQSFLYDSSFKINFKGGFAIINLEGNPTLSYKTNKNLDWSFATDYTGKLLGSSVSSLFNIENFQNITKSYSGNKSGSAGKLKTTFSNYGASSTFNLAERKNFIQADVNLGWSDYFLINSAPAITKNFWGLTEDSNFINLPISGTTFEFFQPLKAYASGGIALKNWGINFNVNRQGLQIGKTITGSIIYNSTFQTDFYAQLNVYNKYVRYNLDVVQVSPKRYFYVHQLDVRPYWSWLKLGIVEGTFIYGPYETRFLNPLMFMHSHGAWTQDLTENESHWYDEANTCQYMGIQVEVTPIKNLRIYALYAQNEIQSEQEKSSVAGKCLPDSLGFQFGTEYTKSDKNGGFWYYGLEGIYTSPFLYIKQGSAWSLYSYRYDMQSNGSDPICSWVGSPFGPDAVGFQTRAKYSNINKWEAEMDYLFLAHGTNSFGLFNSSVEIDGTEYSAFYPSVLRNLGLLSDDDAVDLAQNMKLTGTVQFTNQISLKGKYILNEHFTFTGQLIYSFIFNNKNQTGDFAQGAELSLGAECKLF